MWATAEKIMFPLIENFWLEECFKIFYYTSAKNTNMQDVAENGEETELATSMCF